MFFAQYNKNDGVKSKLSVTLITFAPDPCAAANPVALSSNIITFLNFTFNFFINCIYPFGDGFGSDTSSLLHAMVTKSFICNFSKTISNVARIELVKTAIVK